MQANTRPIGSLPKQHPADAKRRAGHNAKHAPDPAFSPYLDTNQAAAFIGVFGPRQLERLRMDGGGPRFMKAGRRALYRKEDLSAWLESRSFSSSAEAKRAGVY